MDAPLLPLPIGGGVPSEHRLTPAELAHWREHGYVVAKGVFSADEAAALRSEAHALVERLRDTGQAPAVGTQKDGGWASGSLVDEGPRALDGCHNVQFHSALFSRMVCDPRLVERASDIIGPNVQLHHTKLFIKPPEIGAPFPMHQDVPYFEHESHSMIAAVVHFDESTIEKGCIRVVPGSWQRGRLDHIGEGGHHLEVEEYPVEQATPCEAEPGDVLFFSYLCIREWPACARLQSASSVCRLRHACVIYDSYQLRPVPRRYTKRLGAVVPPAFVPRWLYAQPPPDRQPHLRAHPDARPRRPVAQARTERHGPVPQLARSGDDAPRHRSDGAGGDGRGGRAGGPRGGVRPPWRHRSEALNDSLAQTPTQSRSVWAKGPGEGRRDHAFRKTQSPRRRTQGREHAGARGQEARRGECRAFRFRVWE